MPRYCTGGARVALGGRVDPGLKARFRAMVEGTGRRYYEALESALAREIRAEERRHSGTFGDAPERLKTGRPGKEQGDE